jgi:hypothetical protein
MEGASEEEDPECDDLNDAAGHGLREDRRLFGFFNLD